MPHVFYKTQIALIYKQTQEQRVKAKIPAQMLKKNSNNIVVDTRRGIFPVYAGNRSVL